MEWYDLRVPGRMRAWLVEPRHPGNVLGELEGVKWDACSIECGYYIDLRTTAKLVVQDGDWEGRWDGRAWIRLTYEVGDYETNVGTYIVVEDPYEQKNGRFEWTLSLKSVLHGLAVYKPEQPLTIKQGTYASTLLKKMFDYTGYPYSLAGLKEYRAERTFVLERGKSGLEWLFSVANYTGNRVDVTGAGIVTVGQRVPPAQIPQKFNLDLLDPRGLVIDGLTHSNDRLSTPGRVVIHHQVGSGDSAKDIVAYADASGSASYAYRGYLSVDYQSVSDMSPETYQRALQLAKERLKEQSVTQEEWAFSIPSLPVWAGTGITLWPHDAYYKGGRKCFVKSASISGLHLNRPTMRLTLKECASGDKGDV